MVPWMTPCDSEVGGDKWEPLGLGPNPGLPLGAAWGPLGANPSPSAHGPQTLR